jgi:hypothetical protein
MGEDTSTDDDDVVAFTEDGADIVIIFLSYDYHL